MSSSGLAAHTLLVNLSSRAMHLFDFKATIILEPKEDHSEGIRRKTNNGLTEQAHDEIYSRSPTPLEGSKQSHDPKANAPSAKDH